ncbi:hypothetical protein BH11ARM1_BH11ARM1_09520 [soil metagenome]
MHTEKREPPQVDIGYEIRDINMKQVKTAVIVFFAFAAVTAVLGGIALVLLNPRILHGQPVEKYAREIPKSPNPLLQTNMTAKTDIMELRQKEDTALASAPSQQSDGSFRIPIEAAMKMVADQGGKLPGAPIDAALEKPGVKPKAYDDSDYATPGYNVTIDPKPTTQKTAPMETGKPIGH